MIINWISTYLYQNQNIKLSLLPIWLWIVYYVLVYTLPMAIPILYLWLIYIKFMYENSWLKKNIYNRKHYTFNYLFKLNI